MDLLQSALITLPLLAQEASGERSYTISWAIVLLCVILSLAIALRPAKREVEIKKANPD